MAEKCKMTRSWRNIGPGGGGVIYLPCINPNNPEDMYVASNMQGLYHSCDGGDNWRLIRLDARVDSIARDMFRSNIVYAAGNAFFRSVDNGNQWERTFPKSAPRLLEEDDEAAVVYETKDDWPGGQITCLAVDPYESGVVYAGVQPWWYEGFGGPREGLHVFRSSDTGVTWHKIIRLDGKRIFHISIHKPDKMRASIIFAGTDRGMVRSLDNGKSWNLCANRISGNSRYHSAAAGMHPDEKIPYVYFTANWENGGGVFVSKDLGESWKQTSLLSAAPYKFPTSPEGFSEFSIIASAPSDGRIVFVGANYRMYGDCYAEGIQDLFGVFKSIDAGSTWEYSFSADDRLDMRNVKPGWIEEQAGSYFGDTIRGIYISYSDPNICLVSDLMRLFKTTDGGGHWNQIYSNRLENGAAVTTGLDVTASYDIKFDPFDHNHICLPSTDIGLFSSIDGGYSWRRTMKGLPARWTNTAYSIEFDPEISGKMWGAFAYGHDMPRTKMFRERPMGDFLGGIGYSEDGGNTWNPSLNMYGYEPTCVLLDPTSTPAARVLYATFIGKGVYKSFDGGKYWAEFSRGLHENRNCWKIKRGADGMLYLVVVGALRENKTLHGGLYVSADHGCTWNFIEESIEFFPNPHDVAIHPNGKHIYVAGWNAVSNGKVRFGGIFASFDGGISWEILFRDSHFVWSIAIDPEDSNIIYAGTFVDGVIKSHDAGKSWQCLRGFPFNNVYQIISDPRDRSKIYVTTFGGGVFHGSAAGDQNAKPDLITPKGYGMA